MKEPHGKPHLESHDWNQERHYMYLLAEESTMVSGLEYILDSAMQLKIRTIYVRHLNFKFARHRLFIFHLGGALPKI